MLFFYKLIFSCLLTFIPVFDVIQLYGTLLYYTYYCC